jgi:hypothetical protein
MARDPYHIARQEHLGDMLDELQMHGRLSWRWEYDTSRRRAIYHVDKGDGSEALDTRSAERLVQAECDQLGIRWRPVPHPGGQKQRETVLGWMNDSGG